MRLVKFNMIRGISVPCRIVKRNNKTVIVELPGRKNRIKRHIKKHNVREV